MKTDQDKRFIWDPPKALGNPKKHEGVTFDDAIRAYCDPNRVDIFDDKHSTLDEERWIVLGCVEKLVLVVVITEPDENTVRIISARPALSNEQEVYYANSYENV
jgi:uncharacterized DUF497 family protein